MLLEAIDETLVELLGESVKQAFYEHLESYSALKRDEIPEKGNDFALALEKVTGAAPSMVIGKSILKRFYSKLGLQFVDSDYHARSFAVRVNEAKAKKTGLSAKEKF